MSKGKRQSNSQGKSTHKAKPLELRASVPWNSNAIVMSLLIAKIPQYQVYLHDKDTAKKRQWMEETEGKVVAACLQAWVVRWGTDHLRKSCHAWFNNNRTWSQDEEEAHASEGGEAGSSALPATRKKTIAATAKTVLGNAEDNPLAKALRMRKVSPMRLWGSTHNERVQKMALTCSKSKIATWSYCASQIWQKELSDKERAEWTQKANKVDVSDDQQCFRNQLGISPLLAGLMMGLIGLGATQIGKAVFSLRITYRTADGQMMFKDQSLAEDQDSPDFIPFAHFEGGNPAEEDEQWMRWTHKYVGPNPQTLSTELLYDEQGASLLQFTGTKDVFWMRKVLREYFDMQWDVSGNERSPEWWKAVLTSPDNYVDEEWVADFRADPLELNAGGITILYIKLYDAEAKGSPFRFKHVSVAPAEEAAGQPTSTSSRLATDELSTLDASLSIAHDMALPDIEASVTHRSPSGLSPSTPEHSGTTPPPAENESAGSAQALMVACASLWSQHAQASGGAPPPTAAHPSTLPPQDPNFDSMNPAHSLVEAQSAGGARAPVVAGTPLLLRVQGSGGAQSLTATHLSPLPPQGPPSHSAHPTRSLIEVRPVGSVRSTTVTPETPLSLRAHTPEGVEVLLALPSLTVIGNVPVPQSTTPVAQRTWNALACVDALDQAGSAHQGLISCNKRASSLQPEHCVPSMAPLPDVDQSPTCRFSRGSNAPPLALEKIGEENDDMEEDLQGLPDAISSCVSTPVTIASWLDPNACDIYDPTMFTELPQEIIQADDAPAKVQPHASASAPTTQAPGHEGSINDSGAEAQQQIESTARWGHNKKVIPPSTRQLRNKRQAAEEPVEDVQDMAHPSKKLKGMGGDQANATQAEEDVAEGGQTVSGDHGQPGGGPVSRGRGSGLAMHHGDGSHTVEGPEKSGESSGPHGEGSAGCGRGQGRGTTAGENKGKGGRGPSHSKAASRGRG